MSPLCELVAGVAMVALTVALSAWAALCRLVDHDSTNQENP